MKKYILGVIALLALVGCSQGPGEYDDFAACLADSGTKMYGAWWCASCADQKQIFGKSWKVFKNQGYVECSTPQKVETEICISTGIERYPTWEFPDETRYIGKLNFYELSEKSGCEL